MLQREDVRNARSGIVELLQRSFEGQFGAERTRPYAALGFHLIAIARLDVHHRRNAPTEFRAETTGVDVGIGNDIRIKHTEQADAVEGIVHDHAVEQHFVLDGRSAADVQLTALVARADESRQDLQCLDQIRLPTKTRNLLQITRSDGLDRHVHLGGLLFPIGVHLGTAQLDDLLFQQEIARGDFSIHQLNALGCALVFHAGHHQRIGSCWHPAEAVKSFDIRHHPETGSLQGNARKHDGLAGIFAAQKTFDRGLTVQNRRQKQQQHQPYVAFQFLHGCEFTVFNGSNARAFFEFDLRAVPNSFFRAIGSPRGGMKTVSDVPFARAQGASRASG